MANGSTKVVHLSRDAHAKMMEYCVPNNLHASKWIASLIDMAVPPTPKKKLMNFDNFKSINEDHNSLDRPAFWEQA